MRTQLKSTLALVLALLICVSVFAACKGETGTDADSSSTPLLSFADVPSQAEVDIDAGTITMAYGTTFADLKTDLIAEGRLLEDQGETLHLYKEDKVTEITDETTPLENGMIAIKQDAEGNEIFSLTLVIEAAVVSQVVNSDGTITTTLQTGEQITYNSAGEVVSTTPAPASSNGGTTENPGTSVVPGPSPSTPDTNTSVTPPTPSDSRPSIPSDPTVLPMDDPYELVIAGDKSNSALVTAMMEFQKKHKNITLRIVAAVGLDTDTRYTSLNGLKMQLASNNAPDIVMMDSVYIAQGGEQNHLLDLQQFGSEEIRDLFIPSCWESVKSQVEGNDAQYGLPLDCNTILQFYNKDLLDTAGVSKAPSNWSELVNAMERLKGLPNVTTPYALCVNPEKAGHKNYATFTWLMWLWRMGGEVFNKDMTAAAFAEQPGIDALQMYVDMVTKYGVSKHFAEGEFSSGSVGFIMLVNNSYQNTVDGQSGIHFGVDLLPELKAGVPRYSGLGLYSCALPNKITAAGKDTAKVAAATAKAKWAYEFIKFYSTTLKYQLQNAERSRVVPSLKAGEGQGIYTGEFWATVYRQLNTCKYRPSVKNWDSIEIYILEAINAAVNNQKTVQEALKAAAVQTNRQLQ